MNSIFIPRDFAFKTIRQLKFNIRRLFLFILFPNSRLCNANKLCQTDYATEKSYSQGLNESRMKHQACLKGISIIQDCYNFILFIMLGNIRLVDGMLYNNNGGITKLQYMYSPCT